MSVQYNYSENESLSFELFGHNENGGEPYHIRIIKKVDGQIVQISSLEHALWPLDEVDDLLSSNFDVPHEHISMAIQKYCEAIDSHFGCGED